MISPSLPRVTSIRPSWEKEIPPVQVSRLCASRTSIIGLVYGPFPAQIDSTPSSATVPIIFAAASPPLPAHARQHILLRPPFPVRLLCTMISLCCRFEFTSQIRKVLSVPAVTITFLSVGCQAPAVISETCPLVLCISRRYISPLTNSTTLSPSRVRIFACGAAGITRIC